MNRDRIRRNLAGLAGRRLNPRHSPAAGLELENRRKGGRTTDPPAQSVAPMSGAISTNQLFGASAGAAGAVIFLCMWWAEARAR